MTSERKIVVGIDIGTSKISVSYAHRSLPTPVNIQFGSKRQVKLPVNVCLDDSGHVIQLGEDAYVRYCGLRQEFGESALPVSYAPVTSTLCTPSLSNKAELEAQQQQQQKIEEPKEESWVNVKEDAEETFSAATENKQENTANRTNVTDMTNATNATDVTKMTNNPKLYYFDSWKMSLYGAVTSEPTLRDIAGKELPVRVIATATLKHIKAIVWRELKTNLGPLLSGITGNIKTAGNCARSTDSGAETKNHTSHTKQDLQKQEHMSKFELDALINGCGISEADIQWVLSVPACWSSGAKQIMHEVAEKCGMAGSMNVATATATKASTITSPNSSQLVFVSEPEAAALYGRRKDIQMQGRQLPPQTQFAVIDAGAGTVDVSVYVVNAGGSLSEVKSPLGLNCGSSYINAEFQKLLEAVFTAEGLKQLSEMDPLALHTVMESFEQAKISYKQTMEGIAKVGPPIRIELPGSFFRKFDVVAAFRKFNSSYNLSENPHDHLLLDRDDMKISFSTMRRLVANVVGSVKSLLSTVTELRDCKIAFCVGGFASSPDLQHALTTAYPDTKLIFPAEGDLAVAQGATMFGLNPNIVSVRVSPYTFGFTRYVPFTSEHESLKMQPVMKSRGGVSVAYCDKAFRTLIPAGKQVHNGQSFEVRATPSNDSDTIIIFPIHYSTVPEVSYSTEPQCRKLAELRVYLPNRVAGDDRKISVVFTLGSGELLVTATDIATGSIYTTKINYLIDNVKHSLI